MVKKLVALGLLCGFSTSNATDLVLKNFNWKVTDIAQRNFSKEDLYERMDVKFINRKGSICSNRAMLWGYDFKRYFQLNTAKIFLFYTEKKARASEKTWWYHVSPMVNENGELWVMDAGFPGLVDTPQTIPEWTNSFVGSENCKEIQASNTDLIERMYSEQIFPQRTQYGWNDCYYIITPHTYWTPETIAKNLLLKDYDGKPVSEDRSKIISDEYYQACIEATTSKIGYLFGGNKKKCKSIADSINWMSK